MLQKMLKIKKWGATWQRKMQRKHFMMAWKEKEKVERSEHAPMRIFAKQSKINIEKSNEETTKRCAMNVKDIEKKVEKLPKNNMQSCFELCWIVC